MFGTALKRNQVTVFVIGWLAYASTYFLRKPLGVIKSDLEQEFSLTNIQLGWLDTALLLPYALLQIFLGSVGDKVGPRKTFGICLILSGLSMISFGMWSSYAMFLVLLFWNGAAQAQTWPNCTKNLRAWFPDRVCNSVFGVFGTCVFAGGVIGTSLAVYLQMNHGWRTVFATPSIIVITMGVLVLFFFKHPREKQIEVPGKESASEGSLKTVQRPSFTELWRIPMLKEISLSLFCIKVVRYSFYMWLPLYLFSHLKFSKGESGIASTTFEVGGVIGSALIGVVVDKLFKGRSLVGAGICIGLSAVFLVLFLATGEWGKLFNICFLLLSGAFNCGPDIILSGSVPAEIGDMDNRNSAAAVVGIVNGFGSIGTFLEGPVVGFVSQMYGWMGMIVLMIALSGIGMVASLRAATIYAKKIQSTKVLMDEL